MEKIIIGDRQRGKTHKAVEWIKENPLAILAVHTLAEKKRVIEQYELKETQVYTVDELTKGHKMFGKDLEIILDNAELFLNSSFGGKLVGFTFTATSNNLENLNPTTN